jgi:hypothetical protein
MKKITLLLLGLLALTSLTVAKPIFPPSEEFLIEVAQGSYPQYAVVTKFGHNGAVGGTLVPVSSGGVYQTPSVADTLGIVSSSADDSVTGAGARTVKVEGLDENYELQSVTVTMDGTTRVPLLGLWTRVFRATVVTSGTYANQGVGSHAGTLTVTGDVVTATWISIDIDSSTSFPLGQSEAGVYTIPAGWTGYLLFKHISIDANKLPTIFWFRRENSDTASAPYSAMRMFERHVGVVGSLEYNPPVSIVTLPEKTDVGCMAWIATGTAAVSVEFQILLVKN